MRCWSCNIDATIRGDSIEWLPAADGVVDWMDADGI